MCSAVDNYSGRLAEGPSERDGQRDKLIIIIFSMLVVITIIIMAINITVTTVTATEKSWRALPALDQSDSANCSTAWVYVQGCTMEMERWLSNLKILVKCNSFEHILICQFYLAKSLHVYLLLSLTFTKTLKKSEFVFLMVYHYKTWEYY